MSENNYHKITVSDMSPHIHSFFPNESKTEKVYKWLQDWIKLSLECGKVHPYDLLPSKGDLACHIGVSQGTIQNVYRLLEDAGFVESKQRIGTYIKPKDNYIVEKLTSKRDLAVEILKKFILENNYKSGDRLPSARSISRLTGISNTTLRQAVTNLVSTGVLIKKSNNFIVAQTNYEIEKIELKTLVEKIAERLKEYIHVNLKAGEKLPSNTELTKIFQVSVKTIHDAIHILSKEGLLYTRRGQYGTIVLDSNGDGEFYHYEKFEQKIKSYIVENCRIEDRLPSIRELAKIYSTSEKTIKRALDNLAEDGYITFVRGRYGGTFVLDIPQSSQEAYKWLAVNLDYLSN